MNGHAGPAAGNGRVVVAAVAFVLAAYASGCTTSGPTSPAACDTRLARVVFSAVDVETTGLDPKTDRIVEIGVVKFRNGRILGTRSWLVNPGMPVPPSAVRVHGITTEMVRKSPGFAAVFPLFKAFIGDSKMLAHNARYDVSFFNNELKRAGLTGPHNGVVDTLPLFRQWFPQASRHSLAFMAEYLHLETDTMHRGGDDAKTLVEIFKAGAAARSPKLTLEDLVHTAGGELRFVGANQSAATKE